MLPIRQSFFFSFGFCVLFYSWLSFGCKAHFVSPDGLCLAAADSRCQILECSVLSWHGSPLLPSWLTASLSVSLWLAAAELPLGFRLGGSCRGFGWLVWHELSYWNAVFEGVAEIARTPSHFCFCFYLTNIRALSARIFVLQIFIACFHLCSYLHVLALSVGWMCFAFGNLEMSSHQTLKLIMSSLSSCGNWL